MTSKSWPTPNAVQCRVSSRKLGPHSDSVLYYRLTRGSEESLETAQKRSRTGPDPFEGCSYTARELEPNPVSAYAGLIERTGSTSSSSGKKRKNSKRKSISDGSREGLRKRSRETPNPSEDCTQTLGGHGPSSTQDETPAPISTQGEGKKKNQKRKSEEQTREPRKRSRKTPSPCEGPSQQTTAPASSSYKPGTSSSVNTDPRFSRAAFVSKYEEHGLLGIGGFGSVYKGYCKNDNIPVAIKHIPQSNVKRKAMYLNNEIKMVPVEVALLLRLKPAEGGTGAAVTLLDWYDLDNELILVLERPFPCRDLSQYVDCRESALPENEAKTIIKQLVDALIEIHSKGVFHRDIKMNNILIETSSDVPRVRLIDFGCGTFLKEVIFTAEEGTYEYECQEQSTHIWYKAVPTTVWQVGMVALGMLNGDISSSSTSNSKEIIAGKPPINDNLSPDCRNFIRSCLVKSTSARPTLETLKLHPWLM